MSDKTRTGKAPGAPKGNTNAWKSGKYSQRKDIILTCRTCSVKTKCENFDASNLNAPCAFEKIPKPDVSTVEKLTDFLRHLIELDYLRYRRGCNFEIFLGGILDGDLIRLGQHLQKEIYTLARLTELSELDSRVAALESKIEKGV